MSTILKIDKLTKAFGGLTAVHRVDLEVEAGEIRGIIGPNGSGKTTLFHTISGIYSPNEGSIEFKGTKIQACSPYIICSLGIGRTFQDIKLFPKMTALENVMVGHHRASPSNILQTLFRTSAFRRAEKRSHEKAWEMLDFVGLASKAHFQARHLSYGEQKTLEIARAMATQPELLLLDEPVAGMNPAEAEVVVALIHKINGQGITILLVEHAMKVLMGLSHLVTVLNYGEKICEGRPQEVSANPLVIEAYLGSET